MNRSSGGIVAALLVSVMVSACSSPPGAASPRSTDAVLSGDWGGPSAALSALASGATLQFDCAHGRIDHSVPLDAQQRFDVSGVYVMDHGGPAAPIDETGQAARYAGQVTGAQLALTVTITATGELRGPFALTRGATPRIVQCF